MSFNTLTVSSGVELAYTDSGAPASSTGKYTTIFAIHGMCFNALIFKKLETAAFQQGFRFVAINRRPFAGSTPFNGDEINLIVNVDDNPEKRLAFMEARGHEVALFIDIFAQKHQLPSVSHDGNSGGSIVFGWSMGSQLAAAMIAYAPSLSADVRARLALPVRALIVYDAPPFVFGLMNPEGNWAPLIDTTVPENLRLPMFGQWVTGFFDNGDYSQRSLDTLAYVLPSTDKAPTIYSIPVEEIDKITCYGQEATLDLPLLLFFSEQLKTTFRTACSSSAVFPDLKITFLAADRSAGFSLAGLWAVQDDLKEIKSARDINYQILKGANHFLHWEDPEKLVPFFANDV